MPVTPPLLDEDELLLEDDPAPDDELLEGECPPDELLEVELPEEELLEEELLDAELPEEECPPDDEEPEAPEDEDERPPEDEVEDELADDRLPEDAFDPPLSVALPEPPEHAASTSDAHPTAVHKARIEGFIVIPALSLVDRRSLTALQGQSAPSESVSHDKRQRRTVSIQRPRSIRLIQADEWPDSVDWG